MSYLKEESGWNQRRITSLVTKKWEVPESPAVQKVERREIQFLRALVKGIRREIRFLRALVREIRVYRPGLFPDRHLFRTDISNRQI
jgi:hypothetical protein